MECTDSRNLISRRLDGEISAAEQKPLNSHLAGCADCTRLMRLLSLPRELARAGPPIQPSPFFYQRLRTRLSNTNEPVVVWNVLLRIAHRFVPAMAMITLALLSIFAYQQLQAPTVDFGQVYDGIFSPADHQQRMVIADQGEITAESVLHSLVEEEFQRDPKTEATN